MRVIFFRDLSSSRFSGLRSLCTMPLSWHAPTDSTIWRNSGRARSSVMPPLATSLSKRDPPAQCSMTCAEQPSSAPADFKTRNISGISGHFCKLANYGVTNPPSRPPEVCTYLPRHGWAGGNPAYAGTLVRKVGARKPIPVR